MTICCHVSQPDAAHQANASATESEKEVPESHTLFKYACTNAGFNSCVTGLENSQFHPIILKSVHGIAVGAPIKLGSPSEPSLLHIDKGTAATIQFHPGTSGCTHLGFEFHIIEAGHQKQIARPAAHVRVGVTNILMKFEGLFVHK